MDASERGDANCLPLQRLTLRSSSDETQTGHPKRSSALEALPRQKWKEIPAQGYRSKRYGRAQGGGQTASQGGASDRGRSVGGVAGRSLRAGSLVDPARLSSDGCGRKGRNNQTRNVRHKSTGMSGFFLQRTDEFGSRSRLSLALYQRAAGTRPHRNFQSQLLRGDPHRACASGVSRGTKTATGTRDQKDLGRAFSGHPRLRTCLLYTSPS